MTILFPFYFFFYLNLTSVQSPHLSALPHVYHEYTIHSVSQGPVWVDNVLYHQRRETINTMRRIVFQSLNSVQLVNDEGEVVEMSKDLVRHAVTFLSDVDLMSAFTATAKQMQWQSMMPLELWDQTPFKTHS